jgi:hypothetical protein
MVIRASLFLLIFQFCVFNSLLCQNKFESGYVIKLNGDTLHGLIKELNIDNLDNPNSKIQIKLENGKKSKHKIKSISSLKRGNEIYETLWLNKNNSLFNEEYYTFENQGKQQLVKCVTKGKLSLYRMEYIDQESGVVEYIDLLKLEDSNVLIRATQGVFGLKKKKVANYLNNCDAVVTKINSGEIKTIFDVVSYYNNYCD